MSREATFCTKNEIIGFPLLLFVVYSFVTDFIIYWAAWEEKNSPYRSLRQEVLERAWIALTFILLFETNLFLEMKKKFYAFRKKLVSLNEKISYNCLKKNSSDKFFFICPKTNFFK